MNNKIASKGFIEAWLKDLKVAFPHSNDFWDLLSERILSHNYTEKEVIRSVYSTIDTHKGCLNIADIIQPILENRTLNIVD